MKEDDFDELILERFTHVVLMAFSKEHIAKLTTEEAYGYLDDTFKKLKTHYWGNLVSTEITDEIVIPDGLWNHILDKFLPQWLKEKINIKYRIITAKEIKHIHICPHIPVGEDEGFDKHFVFLKGKKEGNYGSN